MNEFTIGMIVKGVVTGIEKYGAFISLGETSVGLIHISEFSDNFVRDINNFFSIGDTIYVKIIDIDKEKNQFKLSIKNIKYRIQTKPRRGKIIETKYGFSTLKAQLPLWIEENLKNSKKN